MYKIESTNEELILRKSHFWFIVEISLFVIGSVVFLLGLAGLVHAEEEQKHFMFVVSSFGVLFITIALNLQWSEKIPSHINLDPEHERLLITHKGKEVPVVAYADIVDFPIRPEKGGHYVVSMQKKDDAFWDLHRTSSREKAEAFRDALRRFFKESQKHRSLHLQLRGQPEYQMHEEGTKKTWEWHDRLTTRRRFARTFAIFCIGMSFYHAIDQTSELAADLLALAISPYFFYTLYKSVSAIGHRVRCTIDDSFVTLVNIHRLGHVTLLHKMPISDVASTQFLFNVTGRIPVLLVLTPGERDSVLRAFTGRLGSSDNYSDIMSSIKTSWFSIPLWGLSIIDCMRLDSEIDAELAARNGRKVEPQAGTEVTLAAGI